MGCQPQEIILCELVMRPLVPPTGPHKSFGNSLNPSHGGLPHGGGFGSVPVAITNIIPKGKKMVKKEETERITGWHTRVQSAFSF